MYQRGLRRNGPIKMEDMYTINPRETQPNSSVYIKILASLTLGEEKIEYEPIPYHIPSCKISTLAKVETRDLLEGFLQKNDMKPIFTENLEFPLFVAKEINAKTINIIDEESFLKLTKGTDRYWEELLNLLKYNPVFGAEMQKAKDHFEEEIKD